MTDEKKKQLFPFFAYLFSKKLNPDKYKETLSMQEWTKIIESSPEDVEAISQAASELPDEEWDKLEQQLSENIPEQKDGGKLEHLKKLNKFKKGGPMNKVKKCSCGCNLIDYKEEGGKISSKCSCNCSSKKKKAIGGRLHVSSEKFDIIKTSPEKVRNIYEKMKSKKIK